MSYSTANMLRQLGGARMARFARSAVGLPPMQSMLFREFNSMTVANLHAYVVANQGKMTFEENESGFVRATLPDSVLVPDEHTAPLAPGEKLRINYWWKASPAHGMGDESIHDHPSSFQSYVVAGGYEHKIYKQTDAFDELSFKPGVQLGDAEVLAVYKAYEQAEKEARKHKFTIHKKDKSVTYQGTVHLEEVATETTKKGDRVDIDPKMIHRVSKYHAVPGEKTLTMNIVRRETKGETNIYLPDKKGTSVKTKRDVLSEEESAKVAKELKELVSEEESAKPDEELEERPSPRCGP